MTELEALFNQVDEIMSNEIYQDDSEVSTTKLEVLFNQADKIMVNEIYQDDSEVSEIIESLAWMEKASTRW